MYIISANCSVPLTLRAMNLFILLSYRRMCASEYFVAGLTVPYQVRRLFGFTLDAHVVVVFVVIVVVVVVAAVVIGY